MNYGNNYNRDSHYEKTKQTYYDPARGAEVHRDVEIDRRGGKLDYKVNETIRQPTNSYTNHSNYGNYGTGYNRDYDLHRSDYNRNTDYNRSSYNTYNRDYDRHHDDRHHDNRTFGEKVKNFFGMDTSRDHHDRNYVQHKEEHRYYNSGNTDYNRGYDRNLHNSSYTPNTYGTNSYNRDYHANTNTYGTNPYNPNTYNTNAYNNRTGYNSRY